MERVCPTGQTFSLINKSSFETLAGQFQRQTSKIICVKDGIDLLIFDNTSSIPVDLKKESVKHQQITGITEYSYRSTENESLYTFFTPITVESNIKQPLVKEITLQQPTLQPDKISASTYAVGPEWGKFRGLVPASIHIEKEIDTSDTLTGKILNINIDKSVVMTTRILKINRDIH